MMKRIGKWVIATTLILLPMAGRAQGKLIWVKTVPDTLSDAYVSRHPALQQTLNHYTGTVVDQDDKPIADAWVGIYGAGAGAPTDSAGRFSFWVPRKATRFYAEFQATRGYATSTTLTFRPSYD